MRRSLLTVLAVITLASNGLFLERAAAMTLSPPAALGLTAPGTGLVWKAAAVCGSNGCSPVQVKRLDKHQLKKTTTHTASSKS